MSDTFFGYKSKLQPKNNQESMLGHFKSELDDTILKVERLLADPDFATCVGYYAQTCLSFAKEHLQAAMNRVDAQLMSYEDSL